MITKVKKKAPAKSGKPASNSFTEWYARNATTFNSSRRERYKNDPAYRQTILQAARVARAARSKARLEVPAECTDTLPTAAARLGVSIWRLRHWKDCGYFPAPAMYNGLIVFTGAQVDLLARIQTYISGVPSRRMSQQNFDELSKIVQYVHKKW